MFTAAHTQWLSATVNYCPLLRDELQLEYLLWNTAAFVANALCALFQYQ